MRKKLKSRSNTHTTLTSNEPWAKKKKTKKNQNCTPAHFLRATITKKTFLRKTMS